MAIPTNAFTSFDDFSFSRREQLLAFISTVSPTDTPFMSRFGKTKATSTFIEWQTDALAAAIAAQREIRVDDWSAVGGLAVRMCVHVGDVVLRDGMLVTLSVEELHYSYRHSELPDGAIVVAARFQGRPGEPEAIQAEMDRISASREASQPLRSKTGGSTFKNPEGHKAWQLVDAAGCRGLQIGGAQVSEKHTNFLINTGDATSADIEALGEEVRARVMAQSGVALTWEIQRVGETK